MGEGEWKLKSYFQNPHPIKKINLIKKPKTHLDHKYDFALNSQILKDWRGEGGWQKKLHMNPSDLMMPHTYSFLSPIECLHKSLLAPRNFAPHSSCENEIKWTPLFHFIGKTQLLQNHYLFWSCFDHFIRLLWCKK